MNLFVLFQHFRFCFQYMRVIFCISVFPYETTFSFYSVAFLQFDHFVHFNGFDDADEFDCETDRELLLDPLSDFVSSSFSFNQLYIFCLKVNILGSVSSNLNSSLNLLYCSLTIIPF